MATAAKVKAAASLGAYPSYPGGDESGECKDRGGETRGAGEEVDFDRLRLHGGSQRRLKKSSQRVVHSCSDSRGLASSSSRVGVGVAALMVFSINDTSVGSGPDSLPSKTLFNLATGESFQIVHSWGGKTENVAAGQRAFAHRAQCNAAAVRAEYSAEMESAA